MTEQSEKRRQTFLKRMARAEQRRFSIVVSFFLLAFVLVFSATACGGETAATSTPKPGGSPTALPTATPNVARDVARGKRLAQEKGCLGCHTTDGRDQVGPTWLGLYGKTEMLEGGSTVKVDDVYLRESIVDPNGKLVQGFLPNIMPTIDLTQGEINVIIAFIKSLQ